MKKLVVLSLVTFAAVCGQADWLYSGSTITEQGADGDPWVFSVTVKSASDHTLNLGQVSTQGTSELVDMKGTITDGDGTEWKVVTMPSYRNQAKATFKRFYLPDDITTIPGSAFRERSALVEVKLPAKLETIESYAFYYASGLKDVTPLFPPNLKSIGNYAFATQYKTANICPAVLSCSELTALPDSNPSSFNALNFSSLDLSESGVTALSGRCCVSMKSLGEVKFPPTLTTVNRYWAFYDCTSLSNVVFASLPTDMYDAITGSNQPFQNVPNYGIRFMYCPTLGDWDGFIQKLKDNGKFTPWEGHPQAQTYINKFGVNAPTPTGSFPLNNRNCWLVKYTVEVKTVNLQVTGNVLATADEEFDPVYGEYPDVQGAKTCTAPEYAYLNGIAYARQGWTLEKSTDAGWVQVESGLTGVCEFNQNESGTYRLTWLWQPHAYTLAVADIPPVLGSCAVTPPNFGGVYYTNGTVVTATAVPAEGVTFVRWIGDVAEEDREKTTITVTMDGKKSITPYLQGKWVYDEESKTVSDGYWTFAATGTREALTVGAVRTVGDVSTVDFSRGIYGGGAFAGIGDSVFKSSTAIKECIMADTMTSLGGEVFSGSTSIRRVVLSKNLKTIGWGAFQNSSVSEVTPFLPEGLTSIGNCAFTGTASLQGDLVMPAGATGQLDESPTLGQGQFYGAGIRSADLSKLAITTIGCHQFRGISGKTLKKVIFGKNLTSVGAAAFYESMSPNATLVFTGGPVTLGGDMTFNSRQAALSIRYVLPVGKGWEEGLKADACGLTVLTAGEKASYKTTYPDGTSSKAKTFLSGYMVSKQYVVWDAPGMKLIFR